MSLKALKIFLVLAFSALIIKMLLSLIAESFYMKMLYYRLFEPVISSEYEDDSEFYTIDMPTH